MFDSDLSPKDSILYGFIPNNVKVLFLKPNSYRGISYLVSQKNVDLFVLDRKKEFRSYVESFGGSFIEGDLQNKIHSLFDYNFDIVICDEVINSYMNPAVSLKYIMQIAPYALIAFRNRSSFRDRMRFLFKGTLIDEELNEFWYQRKDFHYCNCNEFIKTCNDMYFSVERALFYDSNMKVDSIFNYFKLPSLRARKFLFLIKRNVLAQNNDNQ